MFNYRMVDRNRLSNKLAALPLFFLLSFLFSPLCASAPLRLCVMNSQKSAPWRRRVFALCVLLAVIGSAAWAGGRGQVDTVTAEGNETWQHIFDVKGRGKGTYNYIVNTYDHAGNEEVSGPFNIKIDPNSGLPMVKVVNPENGFVIRQDVTVLGTAAGHFGIEKVSVRLDNGKPIEAEGTEYWNAFVEIKGVPDGKHAMFFQAVDTRGTAGPEQRIDFIIDTSPPKIEMVSHRTGDTIARNLNIRGRASDRNGIKSVEVSDDGKTYRSLNLLNVRRDGSVNFDIPIKLKEIADGPKVYYVRAVDTTGAVTVKPFMYIIKSDTPALEVYTPMPGEIVSEKLILSGKAYSKAGIDSLSYEWGKMKGTIQVRPGDPYWFAPLDVDSQSARTIKLTLRDNAKKTVSITRRLDDLRVGVELDPPRQTNIQFVTPVKNEIVRGSRTVIGFIEHPVPISRVSFSLNGWTFEEIPYISRQGKSWFYYLCDFTDLGESKGKLSFRILDANGASFDSAPVYTIGVEGPAPSIVLNTPLDNEVISGPFEISGLASGGRGVQSVHWRFLGPKIESITKGEAGAAGREAARAFMTNPNVPFQEASVKQNFSVPIDFTMIGDGEYVCEVYVMDRDEVKSDTISRTIKVSTAAPETKIITPPITRYNSHVILARGFSSDANGIERVRVSMDAGLTWQNATVKDDGHWEIPLNTAIYTDRVYSARIIAEDTCGIISFSNAMINIDNNEPKVFITSPDSGDYVGKDMPIIGRIADNIELKSLVFHVSSVVNPDIKITLDITPQPVIFETVSLADFRAGEYLVRVVAKDLADNETIISRKVFYDPNDIDAQIAIYSPLPGEEHTGPVYVAGLVKGTILPETVQLMLDGEEFQELPVDRFGVFRYDISEAELATNGPHRIYAFYKTERGKTVASANHTVYYSHFGPLLLINSHRDGDVITDRPWLRGQAMFTRPPRSDGREYNRAEISQFRVTKVEVSYDNGRTFKRAQGTGDWKWRLEPLDLPPGTQPVVVRAKFENGEETVRRVLLFVDTERPDVEVVSPVEKTILRDEIKVYGAAEDNFELTDVNISLRPYDKFWYSVPEAIRGLYFDVKTLGATYFDIGVGLSFFNNNVRFQGQWGIAPAIDVSSILESGGRYVGNVWGIKLVANVLDIPFDWLFKDRDWIFYRMKVGVGANFSWFEMDDWRNKDNYGLWMGAALLQIDIANADWKYAYSTWKYFHIMALYLQPEVWFASTDAIGVPKTIFRVGIGIRVNVF
ncbi:MAG: hypothetical protein LBC52_05140 [Treponema sp.]|jgi:hypothetical protein|nr:hypothetical protein [Treponema sp.]